MRAEIQKVRKECGQDFKIITPGIRIDPCHDDKKRTAAPKEAETDFRDQLRKVTILQTVQSIKRFCL